MAYSPIALTIPQYEDYPNYWLKAYEQGTTTPLAMATDATGGTTAAKYEIDAQGFPKTAGNARLIPFINGDYDLWLFPTEAEADADDTSNAIQFADNLNASSVYGGLSGSLTLADNEYIRMGDLSGGDFTLVHDATNTELVNYTGELNIQNQEISGLINFTTYNSAGVSKLGISIGGAVPQVALYKDANRRLLTTDWGVSVGNSNDVTPNADADAHLEINATGYSGFLSCDASGLWIGNNSASRDILFAINEVTLWRMNPDGGLYANTASGGNKGLGTINATAVYDDNVLLTDYVFDYHLDKKVKKEDEKQAVKFMSDTNVLSLDYFSAYWKENRHLPSLPSREEWKEDGVYSIGKLAQRLWETVELQAVHISELSDRIKQLENK